jgi:hypothetical protein
VSQRDVEPRRFDALHRAARRTDAGKYHAISVCDQSCVVGDARRQSDLGTRALHAAQIAGVVVDDDRHRS